MKHQIFHYIVGLLAICLLSATFISCTNEADEPTGNGRTGTIRLSIPMLEAKTRINVPTTDQESEIKTLRVIISNSDDAYINKAFTAEEVKAGNIVIDNVPVGEVQMYVIANEAALRKDYSDYNVWKEDVIDVPGHTHRKVLVTDTDRKYFPKRGSTTEFPETGLPMSWENLALTINPPASDGTPQEVKVELMRAVAKLNIIMTNTLSNDIVIDRMGFGPFFSDRLYLFREDALSVPDGTEYVVKDYDGVSITVPKEGGSAQLALYVYPSAAAVEGQANPYTIGFHTQAGFDYNKKPFLRNGLPLNGIARNTQVNIYATLSSQANITVEFEVQEWKIETIEVPPFN